MTRTDGVPVGGPLSGILRKAARVEPNPGPLPSSARFLYWAIAQNLFARLNVPDPGRRRIAPCFALSDLPRRRLRHALKMLADVGRRGIPVPFRNALPRAPFPVPMPSLLLCSPSPFGAILAGARARRATRDAHVHVGVVRMCADFGVGPLNLVCREGIHGGVRVPSRNQFLGAPSPQSMPERRGPSFARGTHPARALGLCGCVRKVHGGVRF